MEIISSESAEEFWKLENVVEPRVREVNYDSAKAKLQVKKCCVWLVGNNLHNKNNLRKATEQIKHAFCLLHLRFTFILVQQLQTKEKTFGVRRRDMAGWGVGELQKTNKYWI